MRMQPAVGRKKRISSPSEGRNSRRSSGHQEVDLVPIMNLFVTIIPMLLTMVVMVSIAYISLDLTNPNAAGASGGATEARKGEKEQRITKLELSINVENDQEFFQFYKNGKIDTDYAAISTDDLGKLSEVLKDYRQIMMEDRYGSSTLDDNDEERTFPIIIIPKDYVRFGTFVKTMDLCKKMKFTDIMLGEI